MRAIAWVSVIYMPVLTLYLFSHLITAIESTNAQSWIGLSKHTGVACSNAACDSVDPSVVWADGTNFSYTDMLAPTVLSLGHKCAVHVGYPGNPGPSNIITKSCSDTLTRLICQMPCEEGE